MCWAEKCCYCAQLEIGSVLIGIVSFVFSIALTISSAVFAADFEKCLTNLTLTLHDEGQKSYPHNVKVFNFVLSVPSVKIILFSAIFMGFVMMLASVSLIVGISKKKPAYVLFYFGFGIFFAIFCHLVGLLLLLQKHWIAAFSIFFVCLMYIHFLVVIHTVYDDLVKGKLNRTFSNSREGLVDDDFLSTISQDTEILQ